MNEKEKKEIRKLYTKYARAVSLNITANYDLFGKKQKELVEQLEQRLGRELTFWERVGLKVPKEAG